MKNVFIIGNSLAGAAIAQKLAAGSSEVKPTIVCLDQTFPFDRTKFPDIIANDEDIDKASVFSEDSFKEKGIDVVSGKAVTRINLKRKKVYFEDKTSMDGDVLILCDTPSRSLPDIKGSNKTGVTALDHPAELKSFNTILPMADTVAIESKSLSALEFALALSSRKKEVLWAVPGDSPWLARFDEDALALFSASLAERNIHGYFGASISEILGEGDARAVRLSTDKVIAAELVLLLDSTVDFKDFSDPPGDRHQRIAVGDKFKTANEDVYACAQCSDIADSFFWTLQHRRACEQNQARTIVGAVLGQEPQGDDGSVSQDVLLRQPGFELALIGALFPDQEPEADVYLDDASRSAAILYVRDEKVSGAVTLNTQGINPDLSRAVSQHLSLEECESLCQRHFDSLSQPSQDSEAETVMVQGAADKETVPPGTSEEEK